MLRNPWGKARFLVLETWLYVAWALVPVVIAILFALIVTPAIGRAPADVIFDRRSLIEWMFDPLLSARGRM